MSESMIERVADHIREAQQAAMNAFGYGSRSQPFSQRELDMIAARAAITAMREPTDEIVKIGYMEIADLSRANVPPAMIEGRMHRAYCAMIDAALTSSNREVL